MTPTEIKNIFINLHNNNQGHRKEKSIAFKIKFADLLTIESENLPDGARIQFNCVGDVGQDLVEGLCSLFIQ